MRDHGHEMLGRTIVLAAQCAAIPYDTGRIANDPEYIKQLVEDIIVGVGRNELECLQDIIGEALCTIEDPSTREELGWIPQTLLNYKAPKEQS